MLCDACVLVRMVLSCVNELPRPHCAVFFSAHEVVLGVLVVLVDIVDHFGLDIDRHPREKAVAPFLLEC